MEKISIFTKVRINSSRENQQTCVMSVRTLNFLVLYYSTIVCWVKSKHKNLLYLKRKVSIILLILIYIRAYIPTYKWGKECLFYFYILGTLLKKLNIRILHWYLENRFRKFNFFLYNDMGRKTSIDSNFMGEWCAAERCCWILDFFLQIWKCFRIKSFLFLSFLSI